MTFAEIFDTCKNIAVYGMSINPLKPAHSVPAYMHKQGFNVIPINPKYNAINKIKTYPRLADVPEEIDILNVFRPSEAAYGIVEEAVERKKSKGDIKIIWLQEGIESEEGKKLAEENGIYFIQNSCIYKEYVILDSDD
jgi:predicted CoA-binding protein